MELADLKKKSIRAVDGDFNGLAFTVNANAITGSYCRLAAAQIEALEKGAKPKRKGKKLDLPSAIEIFEGRGREIEDLCHLYASLIKGSEDEPLLLTWDLTNEGDPVECSIAELKKLHLELLKEFWAECMRTGRPKSPEIRTTATSPTISDNTVATTRTLDTQTDANLNM